jgi:CRISPR-associated protein Cas1
LKWDTVIEQKTAELGRYLVGRSGILDMSLPSPQLVRTDNRELRERILRLPGSEARRMGIGKSTLHYLRKNARNRNAFKTYNKIRRKLIE